MATYGQTVTVTKIDQITIRSNSIGTTTGTLVVPTNAEAAVFVSTTTSGSGNATAVFDSAVAGTILAVSGTAPLNDTNNFILGPGTYTLTATTGNASTAAVRIVGSLRTYS